MLFLRISDTVGWYVIMFCVTVIQVTIYDKRCGRIFKKAFIIIPSPKYHIEVKETTRKQTPLTVNSNRFPKHEH